MRSKKLQFQYVQYMFNTCRQVSLQDSEEKGSISTQGLNKTWASKLVVVRPQRSPAHIIGVRIKSRTGSMWTPDTPPGLLIKTKAQPIGLANQRRLHIVFQNQQIMTFMTNMPSNCCCRHFSSFGLICAAAQRGCMRQNRPPTVPTHMRKCLCNNSKWGPNTAKSSSHRLVKIHQVSFLQVGWNPVSSHLQPEQERQCEISSGTVSGDHHILTANAGTERAEMDLRWLWKYIFWIQKMICIIYFVWCSIMV